MEFYKVRLKLAKKLLPKYKEEHLQWDAMKKLIRDGNAEIAVLEQSEEPFDKPDGLQQFTDWNKKFTTDLFIEDHLLLNSDEANDSKAITAKILQNLEYVNGVDYSYTNELGRFESYLFFDDSDFIEAELITKEDKAKIKKEISDKLKAEKKIKSEKIKLSPEEIAKKNQIDIFKKKGKSK